MIIRSITVSGEGKVTVRPDTASLSLGVQSIRPTASDALNRTNASAAALIAALKVAGVGDDDIATSGLSIYPQYGSTNNAITGYQASNNVTVTVRNITEVGGLIDVVATATGDSISIGGVSFFVDDTEAVIGMARADAIKNALKRAGEYAAAAGVSVGSVQEISEASISSVVPQMYRTASMAKFGGGGSPTPIEGGTQDLTVSVTVVYELE
ncbi:MAG: SIMPL domain-containing protein [Ilumatobacteraceae bacterium]